jgi:hypothetical protein
MHKIIPAALLAALPVTALAETIATPVSVPFEIRADYESWVLPGSEAMGMVGVGVRQQVGEHGFLGVDLYGAVRGERGGFITLGGTAGLRWPLTDRLSLETSLHLGAGGGRGGRTLSGGGLLLRESLGLRYTLPSLGTVHAGISHVDFPDGGVIHSTQAYAGFSLPFSALLQAGGSAPSWRMPAAFNAGAYRPQQQAFGALLREVLVDGSSRMDDGRVQQDFTLIGAEWRTAFGEHVFTRIEASAAMRGGVAGYMQVLGGLGLQHAVGRSAKLHGSLSTGFGGGGGVDTAGGLLAAADIGLQWAVAPAWQVDVAAGYFAAPEGSLRAKTLTLRVAHAFGGIPAGSVAAANGSNVGSVRSLAGMGFEPRALRVRFAEQHYFKGSADWRSLPEVEVGNLGFQFDYFMTPEWYLTGQGLGAYTGKAGAYMTGQMGVGTHRALSANTFVEVEALAGAAGGGGLRTGGGLVYQLNANLGWQVNEHTAVLLGAGELKAANGSLRAHVAGLSVAYRFNAFIAR